MSSLQKSLGLSLLSFYGVGMIVGAGVYSVIGAAAGRAGESLWMTFLFAALVSLLTGLSYAELSTRYPKAGAEFVYLRNAFPKLPFLAVSVGGVMAAAGAATSATVAVAFAGYLRHFVEIPVPVAAFAILTLMTAVNLVGIRESSAMNVALTLIEVGGLVLFAWAGARSPKFGEALGATPHLGVFSGTALVIFSYFGFENIANLAEEARDPRRDLPRAILISLGVSTVLYLAVSLAAVALMSPEKLAASAKPLSDAVAGRPWLVGALGGVALFSTANTALIGLLAASRVLYGIAREGELPKFLAKVSSRRKTPWTATLVVFGIAGALVPLGNVETIASVSSLTTLVAFVCVHAAVITLRRKESRRADSFRVPLSLARVPLPAAFGALLCAALAGQFEGIVYAVGAGLFALVAGLNRLTKRR